MDKEEAIKYLKNLIKNPTISQDPFYTTKIAIDTVLDYIAELEKENKHYKKYAVIMSTEGLLINGVKFSFNDYISKQKLRDKIEELEEYQKQVESKVKEKYSERDTLLQVIGGIYYLKELLKEGD